MKMQEPTIHTHLLKDVLEEAGLAIKIGDEILNSDHVHEVYLCQGAQLIAAGHAHLISAYDAETGEEIDPVDQEAILHWIQREGLSLGELAREMSISKSMLSQVMNGKKRLSHEKLVSLISVYGDWLIEYGVHH